MKKIKIDVNFSELDHHNKYVNIPYFIKIIAENNGFSRISKRLIITCHKYLIEKVETGEFYWERASLQVLQNSGYKIKFYVFYDGFYRSFFLFEKEKPNENLKDYSKVSFYEELVAMLSK